MARKWYTYDDRRRSPDQGINDAWSVRHRSLGKENSDESPYLLANEWICGNIAQYLRLPIPPFGLVRSGSSKGMFISFRFKSKYTIPPDALFERCFQKLPIDCTGILLFDILVANPDRHEENIKVNDPNTPTEIEMFDHDRAIFGVFKDGGIDRINQFIDRLGITGGVITGGNRQCFLDVANTADHFQYWTEKINLLPEIFIREVCAEAPGINQAEQNAAFEFIRDRRRGLVDIIRANRIQFKGITNWGLYI